ncbi:tripartite tricarboxylate transporter TctB family protein [Yoonia sp. I 8.24]|uniref:tripartite tricarboxylate transporter TctB family protein n=1 Tax=Yoonia sp. I 8.24 TaxID=1537229 RepID=UPI001EDE860B|nr:tripartite tricarboxylate transporter TctB family protein [Yoonia sp. I 8.24]
MIANINMSAERWVLLAFAALSVLAVVCMGQLVAAPKVLMGRMLTAITPSLFPTLVLGVLAVLSGIVLYFSNVDEAETPEDAGTDWQAIGRGVMLFAFMLFYALAMVPLGFFISSALTIIMVSVLSGNRSALQIIAIAVIGPMALYLVATRVLAVSLPELNTIELFYAQQLGL